MRRTLPLALMAISLLLGVLFASSLHAETVNCTTIAAVPMTINSPGIYCLQSDLNTNINSGSAITVNADNVVIDLNGHVLSNNGPGASTQSRGIYALNHRDITVRNGTVRLFHTCVWFDETYPATINRTHVVEDMKIENCRARGMWVIGQSSTVRRNIVRDVFGNREELPHWGILVVGQGSQVLDNLVHNVRGGTVASGIEVGDLDVMVVNNRVSAVSQGIVFEPSSTSGKYRDNLTSDVTTPYVPNGNGVDAGNNL